MALLSYDMDFPDLKVRRAEERAHTISKKRAKFEREQHGAATADAAACSVRAPRIARVAIRTCLSKGLLGASSDMPVVSMHRGSMRRRGIRGRRAKASVTSVFVFQPPNDRGEEGMCAIEDFHRSVSGEGAAVTEDVALTEQAGDNSMEELSHSDGLETVAVEATAMQAKEPAIDEQATDEPAACLLGNPAEPPEGQASQAEARVMDNAARLKADVATEDSSSWRHLFSKCSSVSEILDVMSADRASAGLQIAGFLALEAMAARDISRASEMSERGTLQVVVSAMEDHYQLEILQELGCRLLQAAATLRGAESQTRLAQCRGAQAVLTAMIAHRASATLQEAACLALSHLAARGAHIQEDISSSGGLEVVLEAMALHPNEVPLQVAGCAVLRHMSAGSPQQQTKIASLGGVQRVLTALDQHVEVAAVQWAGCWALFCLTWQNSSLKKRVAESGGAGAVLRAMDTHPTVLKVQEAGCWALSSGAVADDASAELSDCLQVVSRAMTQHPVDEVLKVGRMTLQRLIATGVACPSKGARGIRTSIVKPSIVKRRHPLGVKGCLPVIAE
mmetsp:Transcript_6365/g.11704  ORF Transcript_6365/g.11704 Transcript_6365/m.11704 type:complete len:564 (-) Transcript_6365:159-1850(-)